MTFGNVLIAHEDTNHDPSDLLSFLLASIVHHSDWLLGVCSEHPNHPFHSIPILSEHELLAQLKNNHLTLDPNDHVPQATGVPPHISHKHALREVLDVCKDTREKVVQFRDDLKAAISEAVDAKVAAEGGVNMAILNASLDSLKDQLFEKLESITINASDSIPAETMPVVDPTVAVAGTTTGRFSFSTMATIGASQSHSSFRMVSRGSWVGGSG